MVLRLLRLSGREISTSSEQSPPSTISVRACEFKYTLPSPTEGLYMWETIDAVSHMRLVLSADTDRVIAQYSNSSSEYFCPGNLHMMALLIDFYRLFLQPFYGWTFAFLISQRRRLSAVSFSPRHSNSLSSKLDGVSLFRY